MSRSKKCEEKHSFSRVARGQADAFHSIRLREAQEGDTTLQTVDRGEVYIGATITGGTVCSIRMLYLASITKKRLWNRS